MAAIRYIADAEAVSVVALDGLSVLFHDASGATHIVAPPVPEILDALCEGPADVATLLTRLKAKFDLDHCEGAEAVTARLDELEQAGLVQRI